MGKYWAAINQPEAKFGKEVELDDSDPSVQQRVAHGFLVPADDVARAAQQTFVIVEAPVSSKEDVLAALEAARKLQNEEYAASGSTVSTAITQVEDEDED